MRTEERRIIIKMHQQGKTMREIAQIIGKTHVAVFYVIKTYKDEGRIAPATRSGRPMSTSERLNKRIITISRSDPTISVPKIRSKLMAEGHQPPSNETIRRRLHAAQLHGRVSRKLPYVSKVNLAKRMAFYEQNVLKDPSYWNRVLWTDESMIRIRHSHGRAYVWRRVGEEFSFACARPTSQSFQQGIMVWSCISSYGVGKIVLLEGRVTAVVYRKLLEEVIVPEGRRLIGPDFVLQQDNAPIHRAKLVDQYLEENQIDHLKWPPQSPDLSPIENMWALLKMRIEEKRPQSIAQIKEYVVDTWNEITPEECRRVTLTFPSRLATMSHRNGGHCGS